MPRRRTTPPHGPRPTGAIRRADTATPADGASSVSPALDDGGPYVDALPAAVRSVVDRIEHAISTVGWGVVTTFDETPHGTRAYGYTVGLSRTYAHPELVLAGLAPALIQDFLNDAGAQVKAGTTFGDHSRVGRIIENGDLVARVLPPATRRQRCAVANAMLGTAGYTALQLVWPDAGGRYPWDPAYDPAMRRIQPHWW
jgi:hypothetical protein